MTSPIPEEKETRRRTLLMAGAVAASVLLLGVGVGLAVLAHRPLGTAPATGAAASEEASETASSGPDDEAQEPTRTGGQQLTNTTTVVPDAEVAAHPGKVVRSPQIAFRLGSQIYVADEDGGSARAIYRSDGAFSLAPDASALAIAAAPGGGSAVLVDVASGRSVPVTAAVDLPTWAGDSSWVAYTAKDASGTYSLRRAARDGAGDALLVSPGAGPKIASDGKQVAFVKTNQASNDDALAVLSVSSHKVTTLPSVNGRRIAKADGSLGYAWSPSGILYFAQAGGSAGSGYVGALDASLGSGRVLASLPTSPAGLAPDDLTFSPDGKQLVLTENGDDGYSRMLLVDAAGKAVRSLTTRRDAYPIRWTVDGKSILYIEGNAIQEETTALYRMNPDGTQRLMVVSGAGL